MILFSGCGWRYQFLNYTLNFHCFYSDKSLDNQTSHVIFISAHSTLKGTDEAPVTWTFSSLAPYNTAFLTPKRYDDRAHPSFFMEVPLGGCGAIG